MTKSTFSSFSGGIVPVIKGSKIWATALAMQYRATRDVVKKAAIGRQLAGSGFYLPEGPPPTKDGGDILCSDGLWHRASEGCGKYKEKSK